MVVDLTRTVRFCISDGPPTDPQLSGDNTFAGHPSMRGLGRFYELHVRCRGSVDVHTGYFVNIKTIDQAVRRVSVPAIADACARTPAADPAGVLAGLLDPLSSALAGSVRSVRWSLSPYYSIEMSPATKHSVLIRQQFDLAAAHRLHAPGLSDDANRATFGKCNNPSGHGHNYRIEPCVAAEMDARGPAFTLADLERLTARTLIDRFDHTHLNLDTPEFDQSKSLGVNPSVENIARVFYELLAPEIARSGKLATLRSLTVWETDKTSCTFPAVD